MVVDYLDGFEYKAGVMQFFPTSEGYVDITKVGTTITYSYVYQYKDHLGNVRMNFAYSPGKGLIPGKAVIKEESHYYPFGLRHLDYNMTALDFQEIDGTVDLYPTITATGKLPYNYKFGGKESQEELGFQSYDFGARNYDPALGRWMNIDPLAETSRRWTPYNYAYNNPMRFIDADGMKGIDATNPENPDDPIATASDMDQYGRSRHDENGGFLMPGERSGGDGGSGEFQLAISQNRRITNDMAGYLEDQGIDPNANIELMPEEQREAHASNMMKSVEPLRALYDASGGGKNYTFYYSEIITSGGLPASGEYDSFNRTLGVSSWAFKTNLSLALTLAHELMHAWDHNNGMYQAWGWNGQGNTPQYIRNLTEYRAYNIQKWFSGGQLYDTDKNYYNLYYNYSKASKYWKTSNILSYPVFFNNIQK